MIHMPQGDPNMPSEVLSFVSFIVHLKYSSLTAQNAQK